MIELLGKSLSELQEIMVSNKIPKFRGKQLIDYIYSRFIFDFQDMTQFPKSLRDWLEKHCTITLPTIIAESISPEGNTRKLLLELSDGSRIETVLMAQHYGNSICVSSQVGCAMGCVFCASTQGGLFRDLTVAEIVGQVVLFRKLADEAIHSLVVMGAGEPLQNYNNTVQALQLIHEPYAFNISYRKMTISTCGWVPNIYKLADEGLPITLALSLHATNDTVRRQIMPVGARYALDEVLEAVTYYYNTTQRRITFEYILINDVNVSQDEAHQLGRIGKQFPNCHINLIPVNGNEHIQLYKPSNKDMNTFKDIVSSYGVSVTIRKEMGDAIQAACGQLKAAHGRKEEIHE
ncbi:23S rRNA (adenine(2503)-C(2))-methyltransferase RlmN [Veillonella caviae]|uniref:23S rRNA (adenine(2503)-C(2))-methyltransferase RlmN n=1 Tax=Veillonella caviae TaxID=248316 RepID=UPI0023F00CE8|nr:23S rRNA (adenine(2503)-C(2))-methyltransferase RlmN [Veillonella caviae]MCI6407741.1 23S rRNA (adenine(2503)-C(2))-methyltransferase RlmN [Veillonella caviae]MDY4746076.1 23S rRNA (adenine(2503)-C(2))-methyltransferase RlmN [Veillonella caviae]MDY5409006.1 23S rRNA (adenine(2503)-C(2))-methyltransferase RlmN [Veillonella caviae]MDY6225300.1 23S rRNA (adenine(2503)-C(2))-methyltransferase RlmN [Veillonella caviae]